MGAGASVCVWGGGVHVYVLRIDLESSLGLGTRFCALKRLIICDQTTAIDVHTWSEFRKLQ